MKKLLVFVFAVVLLGSCGKKGCTDPMANNYDEDATKDDGSCDNTVNNNSIAWLKTIGNKSFQRGHSVQQTSDGGYIISGRINSSDNNSGKVYLIKTNSYGETLWTSEFGNNFGGNRWSDGWSVKQTLDGGYIIAGGQRLQTDGSIYLIKVDESGIMQWEEIAKIYGYDAEAYSVCQTNDGGFVLTGKCETQSNFVDLFVCRYSSDGNLEWRNTFGGIAADIGESIVITPDNSFFIAGYEDSGWQSHVDSLYSIYLLKIDNNGNEEWSIKRTADSIRTRYICRSGIVNDYGEYLVTGNNFNDSANRSLIFISKFNQSGEIIWHRDLLEVDQLQGLQIIQNSSGGYSILTNRSVLGTDHNGNLIWQKDFRLTDTLPDGFITNGGFEFASFQENLDHSYIITGWKRVSNEVIGTEKVLLLKTN